MKKFIRNGILGGTMYAPFCRTLSVDMSEWDADFARMEKLGFNCVHGFAEWHEIEYEKGKFDFSRIDYMIECAAKHNIVAIVNIATQNSIGFYSPRWLMEECAESGCEDSFGQTVKDGIYTVPCLDNPEYSRYADRFLREIGKHFTGDDRVGGFVLWGEPHLFTSGLEGNICYCPHTVAKFRTWLKEKYVTIDRLNSEWSTEGPSDFKDFDSVKPPRGYSRQLGGYASWADWRAFMCWDFCSHIKNADKILKSCGATQPTIVEMNFNFGAADQCDQWKIASCADIVGMSSFQRPGRETAYAMWKSDSIAKAQGKTVFVVEVLGGNRTFISLPCTPDENEIRSNFLQRAGNGAAGIMYWLYRPRMSDTEGGDFGMVRRNGKVTSRAVAGGETVRLATAYSEDYLSSTRKSAVAIYTSSQIHNFIFGDYVTEDWISSEKGSAYMLADLHINGDFINEDNLHLLKNYKVLILPFSYVMSEQTAKAIISFTEQGGVVIADYIVAFKRENGVCYKDLCESGLERIFGVEDCDPYVETSAEENDFGIRNGGRTSELFLSSAEIGKRYKNKPILVSKRFGKGKGWYFANAFFGAYGKIPNKKQRDILAKILEEAGVYPSAAFVREDEKDQSRLVCAELTSQNGGIYTILNESSETIGDEIVLPEGEYTDIYGNRAKGRGEKASLKIKFELQPFETFVLYGKNIRRR